MNQNPNPPTPAASVTTKGVEDAESLEQANAEMVRFIEEVGPSLKLESGIDDLMKEHRAMRSSVKFIKEKIEPCKCDDEAVGGCHRCQSVYLATVMGRLLRIYDEAFSWKPRPKPDELLEMLASTLAQTSDAGAGGGADGGGKWTAVEWGVEQTQDTNWIGPLCADGKIAQAIFSNEREGLKPECLEANDAVAYLVAASPRLYDALEGLLDEQNGPPLVKHAARWQAAVDAARSALALARGEVQQ